MVPSLEEVMPRQFFVAPTDVSSVHVAPQSVEVQMFSPEATAASLVPSLEEVMPRQVFVAPTDVSSVQVAPRAGATALSVRTRASKR